MGTLPDGSNTYPSEEPPLMPGPKCLFPVPRAQGSSEIVPGRYYGLWHKFSTVWIRVGPGESRSGSFSVWGICTGSRYTRVKQMGPGTYTTSAVVRYKTDPGQSAPEHTVRSDPVEIKMVAAP